MLITKVELKNIKNHSEAVFAFQPGVVAICGPNGSGKTTIIEAIAWALFDHLDYKRDDFLKRGTKRGQVAVSFKSNLDGREYVVTRDTAGGYFVYDPAIKTRLVEQKNQVVPWLQQHIGVEPGSDLSALFKTTIGVPQGTFTYDFTLSPANRKNVFDQILKVGEYRDASDNLRGTLRTIDLRLTEKDKLAAEAEGELKAWDETKSRHDEMVSRLDEARAELAQAEAGRDESFRLSESFAAIRKEADAVQGAIERLRTRLDSRVGLLATAREAAGQAREAALVVAESRPGYEAYLAAVARLAELEKLREQRDALKLRADGTERELVEVSGRLTRALDRLSDVAAARDLLAGLLPQVQEQERIEARLAGLREDRGTRQGLLLALASLDNELERLRTHYTAMSLQIEKADKLRAATGSIDQLEAARSSLDSRLQRIEIDAAGIRMRRGQLDELKKEQARMQSELKRAGSELERLLPLANLAGGVPELESQWRAHSDSLARLRAEVARDEEMIAALESGGICPLLTEKCLNLKPGESIDARFRSGLDARRDEIGKLEQSLNGISGELDRSRAAAAEVSKLQHIQAGLERTDAAIEENRRRIDEAEKELSGMTEVAPGEVDNLRAERGVIETRLREAREAQRVLHQAEGLRGEMELVQKEGESKRAERDECDARIKALGDLDARIAEVESELAALDDPRSRARACEASIAREEQWRSEAAQAEAERDRLQADLSKLREQLESFHSLDADLIVAMRSREENDRRYHAFISNEKIAGALASRETEVAQLDREVEETEAALGESNSRLGELEKSYDAEAHRRAMTEYEQWRERSTHLTARIENDDRQLEALKKSLAYLEEVRSRWKGLQADIEKVRKLREMTEFIRDILQKAAPYITESYLFSISHEANQLYREITGRHDVTLQWTRDYEITLEEEGRERPFANLSGGEQMAAALSVRLALLKELSDVNLAFFDEPTTNMDEERRRNLAQQIGRIKDFEQLFVISHDDSFEGYTDQIILLDQPVET
ncbi:MAG: AAA family ATPase [Blastocatellales bacterium]